MTESNDQDRKAPLKLSPGKLELKKTVETGQVRQSFSHGRSKVVTVEVKKKRTFAADAGGALHEVKDQPKLNEPIVAAPQAAAVADAELPHIAHDLTSGEKALRARVLQDALKADEESRRRAAEREVERLAAEEEAQRLAAELAAAKAAAPQPEPEPAAAPAPAAAAPAPAPAVAGAAPAAPGPTTVAATAPAATETEEEDRSEEH